MPEEAEVAAKPAEVADTPEEPEEVIKERVARYVKHAREMTEAYTADWYREKFPGFHDHFYDVFAEFSQRSVKQNITKEQ